MKTAFVKSGKSATAIVILVSILLSTSVAFLPDEVYAAADKKISSAKIKTDKAAVKKATINKRKTIDKATQNLSKKKNASKKIVKKVKKTGFVKKSGKSYYYINGKSVKGVFRVGNSFYYANSKGIILKEKKTFYIGKIKYTSAKSGKLTKWITYKSNRYYADKNGKLSKNRMISISSKNRKYITDANGAIRYGIINFAGELYYADANSGILREKKGKFTYNNNTYYSYSNGKLCRNKMISVNGKKHYFNDIGRLEYGFFNTNGGLYFSNEKSGVVRNKAGWFKYNNKKYYSDKNGRFYANQIITVNKTKYVMTKTGALGYGLIKIDSGLYLTDKNTGKLTVNKSGFRTYGKQKICLKPSGIVKTGVFKTGDNYYYASPENGAVKNKGGWIVWKDNRYYANSKGILYTSTMKTIENDKYYFCRKANAIKGAFRTDNTHYYFADENTSRIKTKQGWVTDSKNYRYYIDKEGYLVHDKFFRRKGNRYRAGNWGIVQKGLFNVGKNSYFGDTDTGKILTGWIRTNNKKYYSDAKGVIYKNERIKVDSKYYCTDISGAVQTGILKNNGSWYYANKDGVLRLKKGWFNYNGKKYYSGEDGKLYVNIIMNINGSKYCMDKSGALTKGIVSNNGNLYYATEPNGVISVKKGFFKYNNKRYYVKNTKGILHRNTIQVIGKSKYYFNKNGVMCKKTKASAPDISGIIGKKISGSKVIKKASQYLRQGGSKFWSDYGLPRGTAWCCAFVWDIMRMCKLSNLFYDGKKTAYVPTAQIWLKAHCKHVKMSEARPGDIIIFTWDGCGYNSERGSRDHIGFVRSAGNSKIAYTIEGNTSGGIVDNKTRDARYIYGIYRPNWKK